MVAEGVGLALIGVVIGVALAAAAGVAMTGLLCETPVSDPVVFVSVVATLLLIAIVASAVPAQRATCIDPVVVLRDE